MKNDILKLLMEVFLYLSTFVVIIVYKKTKTFPFANKQTLNIFCDLLIYGFISQLCFFALFIKTCKTNLIKFAYFGFIASLMCVCACFFLKMYFLKKL